MIDPGWLGYYWNANDDPHDEPIYRLHVSISPSDTLSVAYYYESRSNHGYDIEYQEGTIKSATDSELVVEFTYRFETGWEDYFKEDRTEVYTFPQIRSISIRSIECDKPILFYKDVQLFFKSTDSPIDASFFARVRASSRLPEKAG